MDLDKQLYILACFDPDTEQRLGDLEALLENKGYHGQQTRGIPHHITLGTFPSPQEEDVQSLVARVSRKIAPFPVTFNHLGVFSGGRVLFAAPDVTRQMLDLKECFNPYPNWAAHATLLIDQPERISSAFATAIQAFGAFEGRIESLCLYEFFPSRKILHLPLVGSL